MAESIGSSFWKRMAGPIALTTVIILWVATMYFWPGEEPKFSILNTLFSGLAFAGVVWTILMQKDELEAQRNELELTRDVFKEQSRTAKKQGFEISFYQLVAVHNDRAKSFSIVEDSNSAAGAKSFSILLTGFERPFPDVTMGVMNARTIMAYREFRQSPAHYDYVPYSNNLFNIIQMIDDSDLVNPKDKMLYYAVLANLLSHPELWLAWLEANERGIQEHLKEVGFFSNLKEIPPPPKKGQSPQITSFK